MKGFVFRLAAFGAVFVAAGLLLKSALPYSWGSPWWKEKRAQMLRCDPAPDVVFFGSSRMHWQLAPAIFDSVLAAHHVPVVSYNIGVPGVAPPEAYHLLNGALAEGDLRPGTTVIMELAEPVPVEPHLLRSTRASYHMTPGTLLFMHHYFLEARNKRAYPRYMLNEAFVLSRNLFHVGQIKTMLGHREKVVTESKGINVRGFAGMESEQWLNRDAELGRSLGERHDELMRDTMLLSRQRELVRRNRDQPVGEPVSSWHAAIAEIQAHCASKGVRLIWLLPPKTLSTCEWTMFNSISGNDRIDMSDPDRFPEAYALRYRYDRGHLNSAGARRLSTEVALEYLRILGEPVNQ